MDAGAGGDPAVLTARGLCKRFAGRTAVDGLSLSVAPGEVVGLLGPNGAGKSTTLRMLAGWLRPDAGVVELGGRPVEHVATRAALGVLVESSALPAELRVAEYLGLRARLKGVAAAGVAEAARAAGVEGVLRRLCGELSRGMRQRVGIAEALLGQPALLLLDEPTAGLDPTQVAEMRKLLGELSQGRAVVLSTHALAEAEALCTRLLVMSGGRLVANATAAELVQRFGSVAQAFEALTGAASTSTSTAASTSTSTRPRAVRQLGALYRRELLSTFVSPLAYGVGALFLVAQGIAFFTLVRALADPAAPAAYGAVLRRFFGGGALYWAFALNLPALLTMRLVAEERREGTLEVALTAPCAPGLVILGKFLAAFTFYLLLWLPTLVYPIVLARYAPPGTSLDLGPVATAYLGVAVSGAAFLAIGVLASSLTRHQLLAAALTYVGLAALLVLGSLPELDRLTGAAGFAATRPALTRVLAYLDLRRHLDDFARGILDSRWLVLYATTCVGALWGATQAVIRKERGRGAVRRGALPAAVALALLALVLANTLAARHPRRGDATSARIYTLSPRSVAVARELPAPVSIVVLEGLPALSELYDDIDELLERLAHASRGRITVVHIDPIDDPRRLAELAARHGFLPADLERGGAILVESSGRTRALGLSELVELGQDSTGAGVVTAFRAEAALLGAILDVTSKSRPRICASTGHGERPLVADPGTPNPSPSTNPGPSDAVIAPVGDSDPSAAPAGEDWLVLADRLREHGFDLAPTALLPSIPSSCSALVIAGPTTALSTEEANQLGAWLDHGGRALIAVGSDSPATGPGAGAGFAATGLEGLTERRGIALGERIALDPGDPLGSPRRFRLLGGRGAHPASRAFRGRRPTVWDRPRELRLVDLDGVTSAVLMATSSAGWAESDRESVLGLATPGFDPEAGDGAGPVPFAAAAELSGGGRLIVLGDPSAFDTRVLAVPGRFNDDLGVAWLAWLTDRGTLVAAGPRAPEQLRLVMAPSEVRGVLWATVLALPLALLAIGALVIRRRRR
ncbi:MAG: ATP-binding cassette domain-containing protein [Deltaproteobacteria bacterium]|nr:ATP-binding cassette domain-containing protein [Deltaproteobacteria bacterium]